VSTLSQNRKLPLHYATKIKTEVQVVKALLEAYPAAAVTKDQVREQQCGLLCPVGMCMCVACVCVCVCESVCSCACVCIWLGGWVVGWLGVCASVQGYVHAMCVCVCRCLCLCLWL